jgi:hypothetical protein
LFDLIIFFSHAGEGEVTWKKLQTWLNEELQSAQDDNNNNVAVLQKAKYGLVFLLFFLACFFALFFAIRLALLLLAVCFHREMMDDPVTLFQARALAWLFSGTHCIVLSSF